MFLVVGKPTHTLIDIIIIIYITSKKPIQNPPCNVRPRPIGEQRPRRARVRPARDHETSPDPSIGHEPSRLVHGRKYC